jgi:hypothetical protein
MKANLLEVAAVRMMLAASGAAQSKIHVAPAIASAPNGYGNYGYGHHSSTLDLSH